MTVDDRTETILKISLLSVNIRLVCTDLHEENSLTDKQLDCRQIAKHHVDDQKEERSCSEERESQYTVS